MRRSRLSLAGLSILFALGLALWEVYFFWFAGSLGLEAPLGVFTPDRLGFNMAWLAAIYLTFQLTSIPFALPSATGRFIGVVDGMASSRCRRRPVASSAWWTAWPRWCRSLWC